MHFIFLTELLFTYIYIGSACYSKSTSVLSFVMIAHNSFIDSPTQNINMDINGSANKSWKRLLRCAWKC